MFTETKHIIQLRFNSVAASAIASISLLCLLCARLNFYSLTFIYKVFHCFSSARWLYSLHILFILHSLFSLFLFQVDLRHIDELNGTNIVEVGIDLSEFYTSVEWDILEVPAVR